MFERSEYLDFIASKKVRDKKAGFTPEGMPERLFVHQRNAVDFALNKGRAALFLDTGMGKSGCEAVFADQTNRETKKPSLILTPLAVAQQMKRECEAFGIDARVVRDESDVWGGVNICNYERISKLDLSRYGAVVLDESSILKSFAGATKNMLIKAFSDTPYRLAATATPAPNDHMELGQHAEFLGIMRGQEMLSQWFINDTSTASQDWRLKGHAVKDFWAWVASWSRCAGMPSDLGGTDADFILPPMTQIVHTVEVDLLDGAEDGSLFRVVDHSATAIHKEKVKTLSERVALAADIANNHDGYCIVWCERDDESAALTKAIPDAIEVKGSMDVDLKERALDEFATGKRRVLVSKPKLAGFGLNLQHVDCMVFASVSHSYEAYYQAVRRSWRFGQKKPVTAHVVLAETETRIWKNVMRKARDHDVMKKAMAEAMRGAQNEKESRVAYNRPLNIEFPEWVRTL